jgi:glyoxylate/hydroxypyruvate reductase
MKNLLVASYLEPVHLERIRKVAPAAVTVTCEPSLLPRPRYAADHVGAPLVRTPAEDARWRALLREAEILFDFDYTNLDALPELAPKVRWIQSTSAGIGQLVHRRKFATRMPGTVFTTASGVHARPLAEFALLGMLASTRCLFTMLEQQRRAHWERFAGADLLGKTALIYGHGSIGEEVARMAAVLGVRCVGINRTGRAIAGSAAAEVHGPAALGELLPQADFLVLAAPHTPETEKVFGAAELARMKRGAFVINVARGAVIDEAALVAALASGHLGGAALDVFETEPLPKTSPLWTMPNVLVSPHSASTSERENELIVDLFCDNLRRYLAGEELRNVLDTTLLY